MKIKYYTLFFILNLLGNPLYAQVSSPSAQAVETIIPLADSVKVMAERLIKTGFTAGDGYGEVWIRDLNSFVEVSTKVNDTETLKKHLVTFLKFQQPDGGILDGYIPINQISKGSYDYYYSTLAPEYAGHKNTVETDQETSLIQAIGKYIRFSGDTSILTETVASIPVQRRLEMAMEFLLTNRLDEQWNLLWGATTADWGDVQPEHEWGVELDESSHRAIDVYDNAMFVIAIEDYLGFVEISEEKRAHWTTIKEDLKRNIRKHLWNENEKKFEPHIYLDGSPFPASFNESEIYYHGGTAVAIEAGILSKSEVRDAYIKMQENVKNANASSIGLTLYPVYPAGFFKNENMGPYSYQNGGDWTWFGGRMVSQLIEYDLIREACQAIEPMLNRVIANQGFYEWYTPDNQPMGSSSFRGSAGILWTAIRQLTHSINNN